MVEDHKGARRPQNSKNGGDGEENSGGFAGGIAAQTEAAAASAELAYDDGIEGEEDGAWEEVDGDAVSPHEDLLGNSPPVAFACATSTFAHAREAVPQLGPPVIRCCRQQTPNVHDEYHSPCAGWVRHSVIAQRVANGDVAIDGQGHRDPDGGVDGGKFQHLHGTV